MNCFSITELLALAALILALQPAIAEQIPASSSPILEQAAEALAGGRLDAARSGFEEVAKDSAVPSFVRSLALFGLAETALARKDAAGAILAWQRLADDEMLPQAHRDTARRRIAEAERIRQGRTGRDPAAYRARLQKLPRPAAIFHVAPGGSEAATGSASRPFGTLEEARDAVRAIKKKHGGKLPKGGVRILIRGGAYPVQQTLALTAEDSGAEEAPVVYQANSGGSPVFKGGVRIPGWKPISDAKLREKLDPSVRDRVLEADLKALGVTDFGDATDLRRSPELFCDGVPQTLARWPNEGFVRTGDLLGKETFTIWNTIPACKDGKFRYLEDRPALWLEEPDVRLYGYWCWDWYEEYQKVASIDPDDHAFTLAQPYAEYGYRKDQRYYAVNVFRELDRPGEWYLDRLTGMIYWSPPEGFDTSKNVTTLSELAQPFVTMEEVEHVVLQGLTFQEGRGDGIHIRGGRNCLVAGCTIRQSGGDAIVIEGGQHHGIFGCTMKTLGCGGARVAGGDRKTLTPGHHFVENCTVSDISRLKRTYTPAVHLDGCGNRVAHNLFERIPSSAMRIEGNDHLIELNLVRHVVQESDDQGGIDMFGNPLYRGVVIRWNRWSDIVGGTHTGAAGVRLDDMISGIAVYSNLFERCGSVLFGGLQIHGGKENLIDGNIFLDCFAGISFTRWGESRWIEATQGFIQQASAPPYPTRYPALTRLQEDADINFISRNLFARCKETFLRDGGIEKTVLNAVTDRPLDLKKLSSASSVRSDSQLRRLLFEAIPLGEIGPYKHPWRVSDVD